MNRKKQLKSLFNQLCVELKMNNYHENPNFYGDSLKLDFNSIYGGYRLDVVHKNTSESFYYFSDRRPVKEMVALLQGILIGINPKS